MIKMHMTKAVSVVLCAFQVWSFIVKEEDTQITQSYLD